MRTVLELATLLAVAVTFALSLAHVLEWPGKLRLDRDQYLTVQKIYYPGFTYTGALEPLSIVLLMVLVFMTAHSAPAFVPLVVALIAAAITHLLYWLLTTPMNKVWLADEKLDHSARRFFGGGDGANTADWRTLRDRWERSHALRAISAFVAFATLAVALTS